MNPSTTPTGIDALLAELDEASAPNARAAVEWMLPDTHDLEHLTQIQLQEFLWYQLPTKWLMDRRDLHEVAWSLGDLLAAAGKDNYARICRDNETHQIIDTWQDEDSTRARRRMREAMTASGVYPVDTPLLQWGAVRGLREAGIWYDASEALEQAIATGDLVPGGRGAKRQAEKVVDALLTAGPVHPDGRAEPAGRTPLELVRAERAEHWAGERPPARGEALRPVLPLIAEEPAPPEGVVDSLEPLIWLLEHIGEGVTLTQAGYLPKALAVEINDRYRWYDLPGYSVRTETDVIQLHDLHQLSRATRLLTRRGRKLALSARGWRALADPPELFRTVAAHLFTTGDMSAEATTLTAARLLTADGPVPRTRLLQEVAAALSGRWRTRSGAEVGDLDFGWAMRDFQMIGETLGWLIEEGDWQHSAYRLTEHGRVAAILGLRAAAFAPRQRP